MRNFLSSNILLLKGDYGFKILTVMEIKGKTAIITGASGKLGSAIVSDLADKGCNCICQFYKNDKAGEDIARKARQKGVKAKSVQADLTNPDDLKNLVESGQGFGNTRILINSAAVFERSELKQASFQQGGRIMNLNFTAAVILSKFFAESLAGKSEDKSGQPGKIINITDVGGIRPWAGYVFYCASKAALISATKSLAKELAADICVNSIAPGFIDIPEEYDQAEIERQLGFIPMNRKGDRSEITSTVRFLIENDYVTGEVIRVDGGRSI